MRRGRWASVSQRSRGGRRATRCYLRNIAVRCARAAGQRGDRPAFRQCSSPHRGSGLRRATPTAHSLCTWPGSMSSAHKRHAFPTRTGRRTVRASERACERAAHTYSHCWCAFCCPRHFHACTLTPLASFAPSTSRQSSFDRRTTCAAVPAPTPVAGDLSVPHPPIIHSQRQGNTIHAW